MQRLVLLRNHKVCDSLHKVLNSRIYLGEVSIEGGEIIDVKHDVFGEILHCLIRSYEVIMAHL